MARARTLFPLRYKIALALVIALTASLAAYVKLGTSLVIADKTSYLYDFTLSEVGAAAERLDSHFGRALTLGQVVAGVADTLPPEELAKVLAQQSISLGAPALHLLRPASREKFNAWRSMGENPGVADAVLAHTGWTPADFERSALLVGAPLDGRIPVGGRGVDSRGKAVGFVVLVRLEEALLGKDGPSLLLVDGAGKLILASVRDEFAPRVAEATVRAATLKGSAFPSGAQDWELGGERHLVSYRRLAGGALTAVGILPESMAFTAARALMQRSMALGLGILLAAVAAALVFARRMTDQLNRMAHATEKVQEGDFTVRVEGGSKDEVGSLAASFNAMAEKIENLMLATAEKARMEKELETAQEVQNRFLPPRSLDNGRIRISGKSEAATECGGDWWQYHEIGDYLVVVVGDVNGHGVSSALLTASAYGAYSLLMRGFSEVPEERPSAVAIAEHLNSAVYAASHGKIGMTLLASVLDLRTGELTWVNASHRPLYLCRGSAVKPLMGGECGALGLQQTLGASEQSARLNASDSMLWFTDGLVECPDPSGRTLSTARLGRMLQKLTAESSGSAEAICNGLMGAYLSFLGSAHATRPDDTSIVVGVVPSTVAYEEASSPPSFNSSAA
ncbi:MAG: SpoIIE family protein phosphatase [Bdellovibrionales bacterium]|nr:SpoIIE family protein phosphatase [Bdellovibrionales bacterium]